MHRIFKPLECITCGNSYTPTSSVQKYCVTCGMSTNALQRHRADYRKRLKMICRSIQARTEIKHIPFSITPEHLIKLWIENDGRCCLTGIPFEIEEPYLGKGRVNPNMVSVDRIIPELGYIEGNVRLINYHMNCALLDYGIEGFDKLVAAYQSISNTLGVK